MPEHVCVHEGDMGQIKESLKVAHNRIGDLEDQNSIMIDLVSSVRVIAEQMTNINEKVTNNAEGVKENKLTLEAILNKPVERFQAYQIAFFSCALGAIATIAIEKIFL